MELGCGRGHFRDDGWMATNAHRCALERSRPWGAAVGANPKQAFAGNLGSNALSPHTRQIYAKILLYTTI